MSKLQLINEITTAVKMTTDGGYEEVKLKRYLDDLLNNYVVESRDDDNGEYDNEQLIKVYIDARKVEHYAESTLYSYAGELRLFSSFINKSLLKVTTVDVRNYLASLSVKESSLLSKLERISSFYSWLVDEEELLKNPCSKIKRPKQPKKVRDGMSIIELEQVRAACVKYRKVGKKKVASDDVRKRALVEALYSTACRLDELHKLNISDVNWSNGAVVVSGKGNKERRVFLSEKAMFYLNAYLDSRNDDCEALFVTERSPIRRLKREGIQNAIKTIAVQADIGRSVHPHLFRHTFAQHALNAGMPMEDLQAYLGHEKSDTTARYAQVNDDRKYSAFKRYHMQ